MRLVWDEGRDTEGGEELDTGGGGGEGEARRGMRRRVRQAVSGPGEEQSQGDWGQTQAAGGGVTRGAGELRRGGGGCHLVTRFPPPPGPSSSPRYLS